MNREELGKKVYQTSLLRGSFVLRSGKPTDRYFDKYLFESNPALLSEIADYLSKLIPPATQVLAGLEMGGIPIAVALSLSTGIPVSFVRKTPKEYGTCKLVEGADVAGKNVAMVEDVVTTGDQVTSSVNELRSLRATVDNVLCVIERDKIAQDNLKSDGLLLISLFTTEELEDKILT